MEGVVRDIVIEPGAHLTSENTDHHPYCRLRRHCYGPIS